MHSMWKKAGTFQVRGVRCLSFVGNITYTCRRLGNTASSLTSKKVSNRNPLSFYANENNNNMSLLTLNRLMSCSLIRLKYI